MEGLVAFALVTLVLQPALVLSKLGAPGGPLKFPREEFDVAKVLRIGFWIDVMDVTAELKGQLAQSTKCIHLKLPAVASRRCRKAVHVSRLKRYYDPCHRFVTVNGQDGYSFWGSKPKTAEGPAPAPRTGIKKALAAKPNKSGAEETPNWALSQYKVWDPIRGPPVFKVKDFPPLTPVQPQVSSLGWDTVVGSVSTTGHTTGRLESLECKTEQLEERVAALPNQIMSAVRESFQDMFMTALTQALPEIVAQVSDSVLKSVQPWISTQIKNTTQCDPPQLKRKTASRQAVEESFSGPAPGKLARLLPGAAPAPGPSHYPAP
ncbi:hypothetical protein MTO96_035137 [Rhipicephalus appendiculatus]